jgi:prepilin-type N-terminal cleavage/methylation domain-containing protein
VYRCRSAQSGVTLLELLVVLLILSLILTAAVKTWDVTLERGRYEQTRRKLDRIASAIVGDPDFVTEGRRTDFGYVGDMGNLPSTLADLVVKPVASPPESSRWRGPYMRSTFNESPESYKLDAWGDSIQYSRDSMLVRSFGGGGMADRTKWLTRYFGFTRAAVEQNDVDGRVLDARGYPPPDSELYKMDAVLEYPRFGLPYRATDSIEHNGTFQFAAVPQGTHLLRATCWMYDTIPPRQETTLKTIVVLPEVGAHDIEVRMNVEWGNP